MPHAPPQPLNRIELFRTLGYVPHPGQVEVHRSTAERRVVACGVRWGKSLCAAMEAIAAALAPCPYSVGWCVAPSYDLCDRIFREIQLAVFGKLRHRVISYRESDRRLLLRNMGGGVSEIRGKSADNPVSLLGEGLSWVIVDEAARLHPRIWEGYLSQRLLDRQGWALLISTPAGRGWFHTMYQRGQGDDAAFASWNNPTTSNPHIDPARVEAERALLPERVFRQEYLAEFIEGSGAVFRNVRECATGEWADPLSPESVHVRLVMAQPLEVIQAATARQDVVGDVQHMVRLVVRQVHLEQVEMPIDRRHQTDLLAEPVHQADASGAERPGPVGDLVVHVAGREHRVVLRRPVDRTKTVLDPALTLDHPTLATPPRFWCREAHSKCPPL